MPGTAREASAPGSMTFWEHAEELADRLKVVIGVLIILTIAIMILPANLSFLENPLQFYDPLIAALLRSMRGQILPPNVRLIGLELAAPIELYVLASFVIAFALTMPVLAYQLYRFIDPALTPGERRDAYPFVISFSALFALGLLFGYRILTPTIIWGITPFFSAVGAEQVISIMDFYNILFVVTVASGIAFTFPIFLVLLVKYGIIGTETFTKNRRYLYAGLFILTCIITPDGGHVGNIILMTPMIILMETGIFFAKRYEKKGLVRRAPWLPEERKCRFCGRTLLARTTFCPGCGKSQI